MTKWQKEVRVIATRLAVAETMRLKGWLTKEEFKDILDDNLDKLFNLSKEVKSEKVNNT